MIMNIFNKPTLYTVSEKTKNLFSGLLRSYESSSFTQARTETIISSGGMLEESSEHPPVPTRPPPAHAADAPPPQPGSKPVLVLDMDETMIWARLPTNETANLMRDRIDPNELRYFDTNSTNRWVLKRPGLLPFLREMRQHYRIFVWTAGTQSYADPILDWIEEDDSFFEKRFFRDSCTETNSGQYVKDLGNLGEDLSRVLILDNNEDAYLFNKANGVPIVDFEGNMQDRELLGTYMKVLRTASDFDDVRHGIALFAELKDCVAKKRRLVSTFLHIGILLFKDEMIVTYLSFTLPIHNGAGFGRFARR